MGRELVICRDYVKKVILPSEVGLLEFGISGRFKDDKLMPNYLNLGIWEEIRFDAILVNCHKKYIRGFEFKVSRGDFLQDKKWHKYLKYCNTFAFVCPPGIIKKGEVEKGIGLVYVSAGEHPNRPQIQWIQKARAGEHPNRPQIQWIQKARAREVDQEVYIKIITLMLLRAKFRNGEIF